MLTFKEAEAFAQKMVRELQTEKYTTADLQRMTRKHIMKVRKGYILKHMDKILEDSMYDAGRQHTDELQRLGFNYEEEYTPSISVKAMIISIIAMMDPNVWLMPNEDPEFADKLNGLIKEVVQEVAVHDGVH